MEEVYAKCDQRTEHLTENRMSAERNHVLLPHKILFLLSTYMKKEGVVIDYRDSIRIEM